ncbi:DUF732 domain-containing protein [Mycobacterium sp. M23085]|uniref:DUF732 domain-containing protein n=1 Tax=Mycobacterium sp. M23085 TaxID=3378087 RepID=UPI00387794ED
MRMLVVLAGGAALIGAAAPAYADPVATSGPDASFIAALNQAGITYRDPAAAVGVGKRACQLMDEGSPQVEVIKSVSSSNPGFTVDGAAQFTMIAASAYCPQHLGQHVTATPPAPAPQSSPVIDLPPLTPGAA